MFTYIENKYAKAYFKIITKARLRTKPHVHWRKRHLNDRYYECHHEHPTALGGPNTDDNKAYLTAKEHFVCHLLLPKMLEGAAKRSMQYALSRMLQVPKNMQGLRYVPTGRTFEIAKKAAADAARDNKEVAANISTAHRGKTLSEEHKKKIGDSGRGKKRPRTKISAQKGKPKSAESCAKMKEAWIARRERKAAGLEARAPMSQQAKKNISDGKKGKKLSASHKAAISTGLKASTPLNSMKQMGPPF